MHVMKRMKLMKGEQLVPVLLITTSALLSVAGLFWLAYSENDEKQLLVVGALLLIDALVNLLGAYLYIERRRFRALFVGAVVFANVLATIVDQFGAYDVFFLLLQLWILVVVIRSKKATA